MVTDKSKWYENKTDMDFDKVRALGEEGLVDNLDHISFVNI